MGASINPFFGQIAASHARSLLAYLFDMFRRSLRGSLHFIPQNEFLEVPLKILNGVDKAQGRHDTKSQAAN